MDDSTVTEGQTADKLLRALLPVLDSELTAIVDALAHLRDSARVVKTLTDEGK